MNPVLLIRLVILIGLIIIAIYYVVVIVIHRFKLLFTEIIKIKLSSEPTTKNVTIVVWTSIYQNVNDRFFDENSLEVIKDRDSI